MVCYIPSKVRKVLEGTPQYKLADEDVTPPASTTVGLITTTCATYTNFLNEFKRIYDSGIATRRYTHSRFNTLINNLKGMSRIKNHQEYLEREQKYTKVAGWLLNNGKITETVQQ
ncbi:hypothetical protein FRB94_002207 [Tulasnella sp. JGI-2019a]|nr:hypothetical protein FRB93_012610 [Tulasnella sp. JGI-2019a]KAG8987111.1 hypothetical protein FRB94_002207 [Tulasnella sp. JGI-2019a]KAG9021986.1 hypothetical protein FRB95_001045 [Tulasnella sp. JGI-2019a]